MKKYDSYIYQHRDQTKYIEEVSDLLNLQASPNIHKRTIKMLFKIAQRDTSSKYRPFFAQRLGHTGDLHLALKDLTSLELTFTKDEALSDQEKAHISLRSLLLPKQTVIKSSVLNQMLKLIHEVLEDYYYEDRRRNLNPEVESLSHLVSSIINVLGSSRAEKNFFLYSKENVLYTLKIVRMLIFHKDFVREFQIIEKIVESSENLFKILINQDKCHIRKRSAWEVLPTEDLTEILAESINILSYYFLPMGRYSSRAEMAPTIARKVAESGIIKCAVTYLESSKDINQDLFREILKIVSEICRESQTLVPRLIEAGIIELIMKKIHETFGQSEDVGDMLGLVSNVCLQDAGRDLERKYKIIELFFEAFLNEKYLNVHERWIKAEEKADGGQKYGQLEKAEREVVYITKYVNSYHSIMTTGISKIATSLIEESEQRMLEFSKISAQELSEKEREDQLKPLKQNFSNYLYKLRNFLGIYIRYLREPRIRAFYKENGFNTLFKLIAIHQVFSTDHALKRTRMIDFCYGIVEKELENRDNSFSINVGKLINEELDNLEKITGPLTKLNDFSGFLNENIINSIINKGVLEGILTAKEKGAQLFSTTKSVSLIAILLQIIVSFKLGNHDLSGRLFELYGAYNKTVLQYNLSQASKLFENLGVDEQAAPNESPDKKIKRRTEFILSKNRDILSKGYHFLGKIKSFLDECVYFEANTRKKTVVSFANIALQVLGEFKELKEGSRSLEDRIIFTLKGQILFNNLYYVISNSTPKQKLYHNSSPSFVFVLYEEGAYEILAEKLYLVFRLVSEEQAKIQAEAPEANGERYSLFLKHMGDCVHMANVVYDKFFYPALEQNNSVIFKDKEMQGIELNEYINCIWLNHVKLILPFLGLISDTCKKASEANIKKIKKPEETKEIVNEENLDKEAKDDLKNDTQDDKKERKAEELAIVSRGGFRQFVELFFKNMTRIFVAKQASVAKIADKKVDQAAEKVITDLCNMGFDRKVAEVATRNVNSNLSRDLILFRFNF